jgi:hypothetical protein
MPLSILNGSFTKQAHKTQRLEACKSETLMTDAELLQHYIQCNRIIHGAQRCPGHHRLLKLGFIAEHPVSIKNLMITVTAAGRTAIDSRPAEYVGTHPTLWDLITSNSSEKPAHYEREP